MEENTALVPYGDQQEMTTIEVTDIEIVRLREYDQSLALASMHADQSVESDVFKKYHDEDCKENTLARHRNDLRCFSDFLLNRYQVERSADALYTDAYAWSGISYGIVREFVNWMTEQEFAAGTINGRLFTVRKYCQLAGPAPIGVGVLTQRQLQDILTVHGRDADQIANADAIREKRGLKSRKGKKKAVSIDITTNQALTLKKTTLGKARKREELTAADALKMGLMIEHAFRVSEVVGLNLESFNLNEGTVTFYRPKTRKEEKHELHEFTRRSAESYLQYCQQEGRTTGPLFIGYKGKRITTRAINERVALLGQSIGVQGRLSPHDLRHFWTWDVFRKGNQLDQIISGGGWTNPLMPLRYAKRQDVANKGIKISEE